MKTFKTSLLTIATLLCSITMSAHDFEVDGIYYNITSSEELTVEVTFQGSSASEYSDEYTGEVGIPESVTYNEKTYSVTSIGNSAFNYCSGLTYVSIPNSVTSIGECAFYECSGLTSIDIPNSVTNIGTLAFSKCTNLTSVYITDLKAWCEITFNSYPFCNTSEGHLFLNGEEIKDLVIPNSVTSIKNSAFYNCTGLTSITFPNTLTSTGNWTFYNCTGLTNINFSNSVTDIGSRAFCCCSGLTSVTIGNSVPSIGDCAFSECASLTSITIPESVTSIGYGAFLDCKSLTSVTIPNSVTSMGENVFGGCYSLTSVTFPNSLTSIEPGTFSGCSGLTNITIPNSVTSIGYSAFRECSSLTSITIPNSVTSIESSAFCECSSLTSITIPNSVTSIESYAFYKCSNLTNLTIKNPTPFSVSVLTMDGLNSSAILTVPNGCAKAYSDLGGFWGQFATIKEEASIKIPEANKWSTCALAFDATLPEGVRAFVSTGMEDNYVLLEEVTSLTANTPYVLYAQNGYEGTLSGTVDVANYQTSVTDGALKGAITQQTISEGYVLQNQGEGSKFYNVNGQTFTIPAGKCWLSAISASGARSVMMRFPGGTTDIEGLYVERSAETDGKIYTLDGVEVETMQSGHIYIKDGKKVLKR